MVNCKLLIVNCWILFLSFQSCGGGNSKNVKIQETTSLSESLINANKIYVKKENDEINQYIKTHQLEMKTTGTGLRYSIYKKSPGNEHAVQGKYAKVNYKITLLDGKECYSSDKSGPKDFLIGQDQIESGVHEGIVLMSVGEKALFILPSHLAHGLLGDDNKIPPRSSLVYDIELLSLK